MFIISLRGNSTIIKLWSLLIHDYCSERSHVLVWKPHDKALWSTSPPYKMYFGWSYFMLIRTFPVKIDVYFFHFGIVWRIPFCFFFLSPPLICHNLFVCLRWMFCCFQSAVNKAVNIILSIAKDIPLWKFAYLHHKQQQVSILF